MQLAQVKMSPIRWLWVVPVTVTILIAILLAWPWSAPKFHGRTLEQWVHNYPKYKQPNWREAEAALRFYGTNAIPCIMKEFARPEPLWRKARVAAWMYGPHWSKKLFGPPSYPKLNVYYAPEMFGAIGTSCIPVLVECVKSEEPTTVNAAVLALGWFGPHAISAIPALTNKFNKVWMNPYLSGTIRNAVEQIDPKAEGDWKSK